MSSILVVYGSKYGQTERVAHRIAGALRELGNVVDVYKGNQLPHQLLASSYDATLVAASVLMGHHQKYIEEFVRHQSEQLNRRPSVFVSICGAAGGDPPEAQSYIDNLLRETGWRPRVTRSFIGAVAYTKYNWLLRWWLKRISRRKGLPTDTSRDWDFTDWAEVDRFARELPAALALAENPVRAVAQ